MYLVGSIHWALQQRLLTGALFFASKSSHVHHSKLIDASESLHHLTTLYIVLMYIQMVMRIFFIHCTQFIATSHDLTPNGGVVWEIPLASGKSRWVKYYTPASGWARRPGVGNKGVRWNIIIWPTQDAHQFDDPTDLGGLRPIPNPSGKSRSESSNVEVDGTAGELQNITSKSVEPNLQVLMGFKGFICLIFQVVLYVFVHKKQSFKFSGFLADVKYCRSDTKVANLILRS